MGPNNVVSMMSSRFSPSIPTKYLISNRSGNQLPDRSASCGAVAVEIAGSKPRYKPIDTKNVRTVTPSADHLMADSLFESIVTTAPARGRKMTIDVRNGIFM